MSKPKVLVMKKLPSEVMSYLSDHCEIIIPSSNETADKLGEVAGLIPAGIRIDNALLASAPQLKVVSNISVGYDNFDIAAMKARSIIGTHTPYVLDDTVADLVFGLILSAARRLPELDKLVKDGGWVSSLRDEQLFGVDVHHSTLGIIGMGRIGEAIAKRAKFGFDMNVQYSNRSRKADIEERLGVQYAALDELLATSDFVVLMAPHTKETHKMIGKAQFALMKQTAIFINASRGALVDEEALIEALEQKTIYAAGLDVFDQEPVDAANRLLQLSNAVTLPHIGSATLKTRNDMAMVAARNLVLALKGETAPNVVPELR